MRSRGGPRRPRRPRRPRLSRVACRARDLLALSPSPPRRSAAPAGEAPRRRAARSCESGPGGRDGVRPSSWRCACSTRGWSHSGSAATSSPRSRRRGPSPATGWSGPSGSARTSSFTTAPRSAPTRSSPRSPSASPPTSLRPARPAWVRPFRGAARIVREVRRGEGASVQIVVAQPYAPLLALLAHPGLALAVAAAGRLAGRERTLPCRRAHPRSTRAGSRAHLARGPAAERPPRPVRGRWTTRRLLPGSLPAAPCMRRCSPRPRPGPRWASRSRPAPPGGSGLLALRTDRGLTSRKTVRQAVALALDPALLRPALGQWAVPYAAWLPPGAWAARDAGPPALRPHAGAAPPGSGRPGRPDADPPRVGSGLGARGGGHRRRDTALAGRRGLPGPGAARAAGRGRGRRAAGRGRAHAPRGDARSERPRHLPPAAPGHRRRHARERDQRRVPPEPAGRWHALARGPARVPARALPALPASPGTPRRGAAVRAALRPAPVAGGSARRCGAWSWIPAGCTASSACGSSRRPRRAAAAAADAS